MTTARSSYYTPANASTGTDISGTASMQDLYLNARYYIADQESLTVYECWILIASCRLDLMKKAVPLSKMRN